MLPEFEASVSTLMQELDSARRTKASAVTVHEKFINFTTK